MKQRPILFSTPMVQAILEGTKTQTRRIVKFPKDCYTHNANPGISSRNLPCLLANLKNDVGYEEIHCPYGQVGDVLWVRETWGEALSFVYIYKAGGLPSPFDEMNPEPKGKWKPSIHMPKAAARIWLKITDVKVERLQDITEEDAVAEGVTQLPSWAEVPDKTIWKVYGKGKTERGCFDPIFSFYSLWGSINGPDSVVTNPWVWVVSFEQIKPEGGKV